MLQYGNLKCFRTKQGPGRNTRARSTKAMQGKATGSTTAHNEQNSPEPGHASDTRAHMYAPTYLTTQIYTRMNDTGKQIIANTTDRRNRPQSPAFVCGVSCEVAYVTYDVRSS